MLLLGILAVFLDACPGTGSVPAAGAGQPVEVRLEALEGQAFRLLPGVGPVLAERLEKARVEAGGVLNARDADAVRGVGPSLLAQWDRMRSR